MEEIKISFFRRLEIAIFKLENYGIFLGEKLLVAFKYFLLLILLISCVLGVINTYSTYKIVNKGYAYIENELPEFKYEDNRLSFDQIIEAYDEEYGFKLFIDTSEDIQKEKIEEYENKIYDKEEGLILLNNKFIVALGNDFIVEENYETVANNYNIEISNKEELINKISSLSMPSLILIYFSITFINAFISNLISKLMDVLIIAVFGYIAGVFCRIKFRFSSSTVLAIYSLTLSIVLSGIYDIVYGLIGFEIRYFDVMYLLIAYVYIIAAIFMIKSDLLKQRIELQRVIEVQKQVEEENDENDETEDKKDDKEDKKENKENKEPENDNGVEDREPDGSEI